MDRIEPVYTKRNGFLHIAVLWHRWSQRESMVIGIGKFPANCPRNAIENWVKKISERAQATA